MLISIDSSRPTEALRSMCSIAALAGIALLPGCIPDTIYYTKLGEPPYPLAPRNPASVETYTLTPPARPHSTIGIIQVQQGSVRDEHPIDDMMNELRTRAAQEG